MIAPDAIEALAGRYELAADQLVASTQRAATSVASTSWTCARATRTRARAEDASARGRAVATEMRDLAASLRQLAARRRAEIEAILQLEAQVLALLQASTGAAPGWGGALPPSGDPRWRDVARDLGIGGAT